MSSQNPIICRRCPCPPQVHRPRPLQSLQSPPMVDPNLNRLKARTYQHDWEDVRQAIEFARQYGYGILTD